MSYDRGRAVAALLCVGAVLLAAALFPAAGVEPSPEWGADPGVVAGGPGTDGPGDGSEGGGDGPDDGGDGTATTPEGTTTADGGETTADGGETTTAGEGTTDGDGPDDGGDGTTTTTTETPVPGGSTGGDGGESTLDALVEFFVWTMGALVVGTVLFAVLLWGASTSGQLSWRRRGDGALLLAIPAFDLELSLGRTAARAPEAIRRIPQVTTGTLVGVASAVPSALDDLATLSRGLADGAGTLGRSLASGGGDVVLGVPRALGEAGRALSGSLFGLPSGLGDLSSSLFGAGDDGTAPGTDAREGAPDPEEGEGGVPTPTSVFEAWALLVSAVPTYRRSESMTPAELARVAVDAGLPAGPVRSLTRLFRRARYGDADPEDGLSVARRAVASVLADEEEGS